MALAPPRAVVTGPPHDPTLLWRFLRACVIITIAEPGRSPFSFSISSRIWAWMVTSSAVVGSSAMSSSGFVDRAIAIITRWRMPPDNWCG